MSDAPANSYKTSGRQIAKNSLFLYLRQILIMLVGLVAVRVTLRTLGAEDYGVYNVVAGSVTLFSFLVGAVGMGAQRFFSFYIGKGDMRQLMKVFTNTYTIYLALAVIVVLLTEGVGMYLLETKLVIPEHRMFAARVVFQLACATLFFNIMQAPFMTLVVPHENMKTFAQLCIYEAVAKLLLVFLLMVIPGDKLILYAALYMLVVFSCSAFYQYFCRNHYAECKLRVSWDKSLAKEILSYNGWNLWGQLAGVVKTQGVSIMLNTFFGPIINAAMQIANQVRGLCVTLSQNFTAAVNPQIIKSYSARDNDRLFRLAFGCAKLNFVLMCVMVIPIIFHIEYLLNVWLGEVPEYTVLICRLIVFDSLMEVASTPFATINQATGKIGLYQFVIGTVGLLNLPFAYMALRLDANPMWVFLIGIALQCVIAFIRVAFVNRVRRGMSLTAVIKVYVPCLIFLIVSLVFSSFVVKPAENILMLLGYGAIQVFAVVISAFVLVFNKEEKQLMSSFLKKKRHNMI